MEVDADAMAAAESDRDIRVEEKDRSEIAGEIRIRATSATVFALSTESREVMTWLAHYAEADARAHASPLAKGLPLGRASRTLSRNMPATFARVHRSAIINIARIRELRRQPLGGLVAVLSDGTTVAVSRGRRAQLEGRLGGARLRMPHYGVSFA
jgi:hypothetical protein